MPVEDDYSAEIDWMYQCLGLGDERDIVGSLIFREILIANREERGISSRELMFKCNVTQAAVVYHLNLFMRTGLLVKEGRIYYLRAKNLERTLEEIENDLARRFDILKRIGRKIDEGFQ